MCLVIIITQHLSCQTSLIVKVWEDDVEVGGDDLIDQINIAMLSSVFDSNKSNPLTIEGMKGIGNFTLAFYYLITNPTSCNAEDSPTLSTAQTCSSSMPGGKCVMYVNAFA